MRTKLLPILLIAFTFVGCYKQERNCNKFRTGKFTFESYLDGELQKTTFVRNDSIEIDFFQGKSDTASIRWINNCEYILTNLNPKNMAQKKPLHIKILTTDGNSYVFEYGLVGETEKQKGTIVKV
ncbi:MAG TPA: DNA topoisomerase IV, partial [Salinimicrobium sp.]|nr:DNA topoisomerase IV [Salinimicrobium sp.]